MNQYIEQFLSLNCAGDVLNACTPINNPSKEISEAMAMVRHIKSLSLEKKNHYDLIDLCAGNALTSVISIHLLPIIEALAFDIKPRERHYRQVRHFTYVKADIWKKDFESFLRNYFISPMILATVHPCSNLAHRIIQIYLNLQSAKHLILMPCCHGKLELKYPELLQKKLGKYLLWSWDLAREARGTLIQDKNILSPCNAVIVAHKE